MDNLAFKVKRYSIAELINIFKDHKYAIESKIENKFHNDYFESYFKFFNEDSITIIIENKYIDHDYIEDFSSYYVRCFPEYIRYCKRLHFFNIIFSEEDFLTYLKNPSKSNLNENNLNESYLGFIIVKPLPETIIGRTCLRTYDSENNRRNYPVIRDYPVNLFGIKLNVKSLAFQEQDTVAAACATSALWSVFQGTGIIFHHSLPSPIEITKLATENMPVISRPLPSKGLYAYEIAQAIRSISLEPELFKAYESKQLFKACVYAYLQGEIPFLLTAYIIDSNNIDENDIKQHALAVTGYSLGGKLEISKQNGIFLKSSTVDEIYVHDDQIGPFARMRFDERIVKIKDKSYYTLDSSWRDKNRKLGDILFAPDLVFIPLYHKIRIPLERIIFEVNTFDSFFQFINNENILIDLLNNDRIEWEIVLNKNSILKNDLHKRNFIKEEIKLAYLLKDLPRYIWRAKAYIKAQLFFELVFDTTDTERGNVFLYAIEYQGNLFSGIHKILQYPKYFDIYYKSDAWQILKYFHKNNF